MTNADCIRHMSDEQLYEFLSEWECGDIDYAVTFCDLCSEATKRGEVGNVLNLDCDGCRKHWLQRDAVEYGGLMYWKRNTVFDTADRKTESSSEIPNNSTISKMEQVEDEPQRELVNDSPILAKDLVDDEFNPYDEECMRCKHLKLQCEFVPSYCKYEPRDETQTEEPPMDEYYKDHDEFYEPQERSSE